MHDQTSIKFGVRTIVFDKDKGVYLNGKPIKIKGVCVHQDHAGVGVALPDRIQYYRIERLKKMGVNAYRSGHHPPAQEIIEACDSLGMFVMDETRILSSSKVYIEQFKQMILRDRNHPSVMIWSIGNEEKKVQNNEKGRKIAETMIRVQRQVDPSRLCTYGGNNGNQYEGINEIIDVRGFNYMNMNSNQEYTNIDEYREKYPHQPLWGSEEASTMCTRGEYFVDSHRQYMSDYDKEENKQRFWNARAEEWWSFYDAREWLAGGFIWTGFDYRGEPSPYRWPNISSNFGVMDICGFPKNNFFYYQAWWTDKDVLHIYPHWNWPHKLGENINVWCQTNCEEVELFLNGKSLGTKKVKKNSHLEWDVPFTPGTLEARGVKNGKILTKKIETTGPATQIVITPDRNTIHADGSDVSIINITVADDEGREVAIADNFIAFNAEGPGKIIGVGNGDPRSHEPEKLKGENTTVVYLMENVR
ncbi:MAG: glycoside hydrolase family 2 protein [Cyclobacteriaceae bacterium]|nr:glycoside hydrolase family 2 protein [Cyclobacteriaceae bacterium]